MNLRKLVLLVFLCLAWIAELNAQSNNPDLDKFMIRKMKNSDRIGLQAAYISNGKLTWCGSYGLKTFDENEKVNDSTVFMVASISKPVTALAVMKLYDEGRLQLDEDINHYLPFKVSNPNFHEEILTVRMLLSHVSSIRDNWEQLEKGYTIDHGGDSQMSLEDYLKSYLLPGGVYYDAEKNFYAVGPGIQQRYSNIGYSLLGYIVERVSKQPFNEYMREAIFKPLKMHNTFWFLSEIPHDNLATPHNMPYKETDYKGTQKLNHFGYPGYPSGQLRTTATDYAQFVMLFLNQGKVGDQQILKKETIDEFLSVQYPEADKYQAISWSYKEFQNFIYNMIMPRVPSHTGLDPGMNSVVSFDPENKTGVVIISNSPTTTLWSEKIIYLDMVKRLFKEARKSAQ